MLFDCHFQPSLLQVIVVDKLVPEELPHLLDVLSLKLLLNLGSQDMFVARLLHQEHVKLVEVKGVATRSLRECSTKTTRGCSLSLIIRSYPQILMSLHLLNSHDPLPQLLSCFRQLPLQERLLMTLLEPECCQQQKADSQNRNGNSDCLVSLAGFFFRRLRIKCYHNF